MCGGVDFFGFFFDRVRSHNDAGLMFAWLKCIGMFRTPK